MPRNIRQRKVDHIPRCQHFKPSGVPSYDLEEVVLKVEEAEAIRLKDWLEMDQETCANQMNISRQTFQRVLHAARKKIAEVLIEGKALRIEGGAYEFQDCLQCPRCDYSLLRPRDTVCPKCGTYLEGEGGGHEHAGCDGDQ